MVNHRRRQDQRPQRRIRLGQNQYRRQRRSQDPAIQRRSSNKRLPASTCWWRLVTWPGLVPVEQRLNADKPPAVPTSLLSGAVYGICRAIDSVGGPCGRKLAGMAMRGATRHRSVATRVNKALADRNTDGQRWGGACWQTESAPDLRRCWLFAAPCLPQWSIIRRVRCSYLLVDRMGSRQNQQQEWRSVPPRFATRARNGV